MEPRGRRGDRGRDSLSSGRAGGGLEGTWTGPEAWLGGGPLPGFPRPRCAAAVGKQEGTAAPGDLKERKPGVAARGRGWGSYPARKGGRASGATRRTRCCPRSPARCPSLDLSGSSVTLLQRAGPWSRISAAHQPPATVVRIWQWCGYST
ncbi:PREDICTED: uncharacterized protein LOC105511293 [Colobus angolensis palliatus]|uniref:uncharacterized protein LOC105511293 n=1 Tax=Colobus angolensis palliatus TaxID=336983 RepID=UPI0005F41A6A|nr:PREDICTED: uncharacterized protein LOC105511293 [Colobus angolensis palliatus]